MADEEQALQPPARHMFSKTNGHRVEFDEGGFNICRRVLCFNKVLLLSSVKRYLNCTNDDLSKLFNVARHTLKNAIPAQCTNIAKMGQEAEHMRAEDMAAFKKACIQPLRNQILSEIKSIEDFFILERLAQHGLEALVSRADFFEHLLPCAKRVFPGALYGQWVDFLLEFKLPLAFLSYPCAQSHQGTLAPRPAIF
jgi:hypothetical protein